MTPATATRSKPKLTPETALAEFENRQANWAKSEEAWRDISRLLANKVVRSRDLHEERRKRIHREPELVNHLDEPIGEKNPIREIDAEIEKVGNLEELRARVDHAQRLAGSAKQSAANYLVAHFPLVVRGRWSEAERIAADVNEKVTAAHAAALEYLDFIRWASGITVMAGRDPRSVPGLDAVAELRRRLEGWDLPTPLPEAA